MCSVTAPSHTTHGPPSNLGQIIAWVMLLFALTVIGALPLLLQGLNLTAISQSTPHVPLIMIGMLATSCSPTLAALFVARIYPGAEGLSSVFRGGKGVARGANLVRDRTDRACASVAAGKSD